MIIKYKNELNIIIFNFLYSVKYQQSKTNKNKQTHLNKPNNNKQKSIYNLHS